MLRQFLLAGLSALVLAAPAGAQPAQLLPGVTSEHEVEFTPHGPVAIDVITAPQPGSASGLYTLGPVLAGGTVSGPHETVADIEREISGSAVAVGVNGDFGAGRDGHPNGIVVAGGAYEHSPTPSRSSIVFDSTGQMHVVRLSFAGTWQGKGQREPLAGVNQPPRAGQTALFTPAFGPQTPPLASAAYAVVEPFPAAEPNTPLTAAVSATGTGPVTIPADGAVLVSAGSEAATLQAEAPQGTQLTVLLPLPSKLGTVEQALGGGPLLVRDGEPVFRTNENFPVGELTARDARAAVGQLADGRVILVAVDGEQPGYSTGLTAYELAQTMARLGAQTAAGLAYGKPVTAAFDGTLLDRPLGGGVPVKEALLLRYDGVYAPPPSIPVVEAAGGPPEQLSYQLVRPSTVTASVVGPDGVVHTLDSGSRQPGVYQFSWSDDAEEGTWHWDVKAVDDLGHTSVADVTFRYDLTLSGLQVPGVARGGVAAAFTLSRPATVTLSVETPQGVVVSIGQAQALPAGTQTLSWDGTTATGAAAPPGRYVVHVTAVSSIGQSDLEAELTLERSRLPAQTDARETHAS